MISVRSSNRNSDPNAPKDTRSKVVMELLETERKYVQDMEILQVSKAKTSLVICPRPAKLHCFRHDRIICVSCRIKKFCLQTRSIICLAISTLWSISSVGS